MQRNGAGNHMNHSQMLYEPVPGGQSPRGHPKHGNNSSTLDEMNHGSPVPSRRNDNYHHNYNSATAHHSGMHSPKLTK